ncbi:mucin-1-like isoform X2 [Phyllopteryx taeniolatus]|uniref:mucin-1-like isoform X2 n=1 Tax=Phyllopteryx taeniolatus TaxID=161469 RepID=UPI002AD54FCC|nr:mucin-1-like isoform X2 [Phyllopteryx taeniolatus]
MWTMTTRLLAVGITACIITGGVSTTTLPAPSTGGSATVGASTDSSTGVMTTQRRANNTQQYTPFPVSTATTANVTTVTPTWSNATWGAASKTPPPAGGGGGIPGWGIALLVLAAVLLTLLLLMLVTTMLWCCCNRGRYNSPDDIPLYTTHSRFWNAKSALADDVDKK